MEDNSPELQPNIAKERLEQLSRLRMLTCEVLPSAFEQLFNSAPKELTLFIERFVGISNYFFWELDKTFAAGEEDVNYCQELLLECRLFKLAIVFRLLDWQQALSEEQRLMYIDSILALIISEYVGEYSSNPQWDKMWMFGKARVQEYLNREEPFHLYNWYYQILHYANQGHLFNEQPLIYCGILEVHKILSVIKQHTLGFVYAFESPITPEQGQ